MLGRLQVRTPWPALWPHSLCRLNETTFRQQQTQRTLLDWLRVEYGIEKPSTKLLALADLDSDTWVAEVKRVQSKKMPLTGAGGWRVGRLWGELRSKCHPLGQVS